MAQNATLFIDQGCTYRARVNLVTSGTTTPYDLTGCSAAMSLRSNYGAPTTWVDLTSVAGLTLGGTAGTVDIVLTALQTAAFPVPPVANQQLPVGQGVFDLVITVASGDVLRALKGTVSVTAGVTLPAGAGAPQ
jgi:hypothetical protein